MSHGLPLNLDELEQALVRACGLIISELMDWRNDTVFKEMSRPHLPPSLSALRAAHHARMLSHDLMVVSVTLRTADDRESQKLLRHRCEAISFCSGWTRASPPTFRDVCSKIIHASAARFRPAMREEDGEFTKNLLLALLGVPNSPVVDLSGEERGQPWRAKLDLLGFLEHAAHATQRLRLLEKRRELQSTEIAKELMAYSDTIAATASSNTERSS